MVNEMTLQGKDDDDEFPTAIVQPVYTYNFIG